MLPSCSSNDHVCSSLTALPPFDSGDAPNLSFSSLGRTNLVGGGAKSRRRMQGEEEGEREGESSAESRPMSSSSVVYVESGEGGSSGEEKHSPSSKAVARQLSRDQARVERRSSSRNASRVKRKRFSVAGLRFIRLEEGEEDLMEVRGGKREAEGRREEEEEKVEEELEV